MNPFASCHDNIRHDGYWMFDLSSCDRVKNVQTDTKPTVITIVGF